MARKEFGKRVKAAAFKRCGGADNPRCEGCSQPLKPGGFQYDHAQADGLGGEPTLENCVVLCTACHTEKTEKHDKPIMRKADAQRDAHWGITRAKRPIPRPPKAEKRPSKELPPRRPLFRQAS